MSWQADLARAAEEALERARERPQPWWVRFSPLPVGIFADGDDRHAVNRTLYNMRVPVRPTPTDREGVTWYQLDGIEFIVADEEDMPAVMRCVRLTGLHGTYRKAGTETEYRF